jgi:hypothetical protein
MTALVAGVLFVCFYKLYLYSHDREQFEDSNLLVSLVFTLIVAGLIYLLLGLISVFSSSGE